MRRRSAGYIGAGRALNLVRRRYERIGGHRFLRLHVIDDLALGKLVKYAGGVVRLLVSGGWYGSDGRNPSVRPSQVRQMRLLQ